MGADWKIGKQLALSIIFFPSSAHNITAYPIKCVPGNLWLSLFRPFRYAYQWGSGMGEERQRDGRGGNFAISPACQQPCLPAIREGRVVIELAERQGGPS